MSSIDMIESNTMNPEVVANDVLPVTQGMDQSQTLRDAVEKAMANYFSQLEGQDVKDVYDLVQNEVEAPLLEAVMKFTRDNQTKASQVLGLNRGTLRKKLKQYGLL